MRPLISLCGTWLALVFLVGCTGDLEKKLDSVEARGNEDRDRVSAIESEVRSLREDNRGLRADLAALRKSIESLEKTASDKVAVPAAPTAVELTIATDPAGAEVFIDNQRVGFSPMVFSAVKDQRISLALRKKGYRPVIKVVEVVADLKTSFALEKE